MSWKLSPAIQKHGPENALQRTVLRILADYVRDPGIIAWPSVTTIAAEAALGERATRNALRDLAADGWITTAIGGRPNRPSVYTLTDKTRHLVPGKRQGDTPRNPAPHDRKPGTRRPETRHVVPPSL